MTNIEQTIKAQREKFYQHMLKSTPILNSFERASLKLKYSQSIKQILEVLGEEEENEKKRSPHIGIGHLHEAEVEGTYNLAKQDTINRLKEVIALL